MATTPRTRTTAARPARRSSPAMDAKSFKTSFDAVVDNIETVIKGKTDVVRLSLVAILCEGHVLFEDVPGGKTKFTVRWAPHNASASEVQTFDSNRDSMTQGWSGTMEQLDIYLAKIA